MDLSELRAQLRLVSGVEMDSLRSDAELNLILADADAEINDAQEWPWKEATEDLASVEDQATYTLTTVQRVRSVVYFPDGATEAGVPLREVPRRHIDRYGPPESGEPRLYAREGVDKIVLSPTPDADGITIRVTGWKDPDRLENDADEPAIPEKYHSAIVYLASSALLNDEGQYELSKRHFERAAGFLARMRAEYIMSHDDAPIVMGGGGREPVETTGRLWPWRR